MGNPEFRGWLADVDWKYCHHYSQVIVVNSWDSLETVCSLLVSNKSVCPDEKECPDQRIVYLIAMWRSIKSIRKDSHATCNTRKTCDVLKSHSLNWKVNLGTEQEWYNSTSTCSACVSLLVLHAVVVNTNFLLQSVQLPIAAQVHRTC